MNSLLIGLLVCLSTKMFEEKLRTTFEAHKLLMESAIHSVKQDVKSENAAVREYGVNRQSLRNRMQNLHSKPNGHPLKTKKRLADSLLNYNDMVIPLNRHHCHRLIS